MKYLRIVFIAVFVGVFGYTTQQVYQKIRQPKRIPIRSVTDERINQELDQSDIPNQFFFPITYDEHYVYILALLIQDQLRDGRLVGMTIKRNTYEIQGYKKFLSDAQVVPSDQALDIHSWVIGCNEKRSECIIHNYFAHAKSRFIRYDYSLGTFDLVDSYDPVSLRSSIFPTQTAQLKIETVACPAELSCTRKFRIFDSGLEVYSYVSSGDTPVFLGNIDGKYLMYVSTYVVDTYPDHHFTHELLYIPVTRKN